MGNKQNSSNKSYYNLIQKEIKNSYDYIQTSEFNQQYSMKKNKFVIDNSKKINLIKTQEKMIDWKAYLLNELSTRETQGWKPNLYYFISWLPHNYKIYLFENEIFTEQYVLLNFPQYYLKDSKRKNEPILFLFGTDELEYYSSKEKIGEKIREEKRNDIQKDKNIKRSLIKGSLTEDEIFIDNQELSNNKILNKYNSYKIREHIAIIRKQIEDIKHPINIIITKFAEIYTEKINKEYKTLKEENIPKEIIRIKENVINDIQTFIEIISVALKLFYAKTINYEFFISERDEFINLICFILFNQEKLYNSIFKLFELSNEQKYKNLQNQIKNIGIIEPKDAGISTRFYLDDNNKEIEIISKNIKKRGIVNLLEKIEIRERFNTPREQKIIIEEENNIKNIKIEEPKKSKYGSFYVSKNDILNLPKNTKNNKEKKDKRRPTISSYRSFSEKINSLDETLIEKYQDDLDENPSLLHFPSIDEYNNNLKKPYGEVINYISTINDYHIPLDKLTIIALSSVLITDCVNNFWKYVKGLPEKYLNIDADELMSIYLYIVYNINLPSIYTQLDFINYFTGNATKQSMVGYYYTTIEGCLNFIMKVNNKEDLVNYDEN